MLQLNKGARKSPGRVAGRFSIATTQTARNPFRWKYLPVTPMDGNIYQGSLSLSSCKQTNLTIPPPPGGGGGGKNEPNQRGQADSSKLIAHSWFTKRLLLSRVSRHNRMQPRA